MSERDDTRTGLAVLLKEILQELPDSTSTLEFACPHFGTLKVTFAGPIRGPRPELNVITADDLTPRPVDTRPLVSEEPLPEHLTEMFPQLEALLKKGKAIGEG